MMYQQIKEIRLPPVQAITKPAPFDFYRIPTGNDCVFYTIPSSREIDLVKIEIVVDAGRYEESKRLSSRFCARMLKEGTVDRNSDEINDIIDFYGAQFNVQYHLDHASFKLICLTRYCRDLIPLIFEILTRPRFDPIELQRLQKRAKARLKLSMADNDALSFRVLTERIFGSDHPYGYNSNEADIEAVRVEDLAEFHHRNYRRSNYRIYLSGSFDESIQQDMLRYIDQLPQQTETGATGKKPAVVQTIEPGIVFEQNKYALKAQSSVKMGKRIIGRNHPDYLPVHFVNTLLGGFFGSRLMQNIREKEGLTYNIYSDLEQMKHDAFFMIGTDVKAENSDRVIGMIHEELEKLEYELISGQELRLVRNYIKGYLLGSLDGVFSKAAIVKMLTLENMEVNEIYGFFDRLDEIVAEDIPELVKKYLKKEELYTVVVN